MQETLDHRTVPPFSCSMFDMLKVRTIYEIGANVVFGSGHISMFLMTEGHSKPEFSQNLDLGLSEGR